MSLIAHRYGLMFGAMEANDRNDSAAPLPRLMAYQHGHPVGLVEVVECEGCLLTLDLAWRWGQMVEAAKQDGIHLRLSSGFRSMEEQERLWREHLAGTRPTPVAMPGHSRHQNGVALDIHVGSSPDSPEYLWLSRHAAKWGLTNVGATFAHPEWWHWELTHPEAKPETP